MLDLLSTVITSALVATIAGAAITEWLESRRKNHTTRFDALAAATTLEGYAITCADRISDHKLAVDSEGHAGTYLGAVPELPEISIVAGFIRPRKAEIANRLMGFPQQVRQAGQMINFIWDVTADPEEVQEMAARQAAAVGIQALDLANDLREAFDLPTRDLTFGQFDVRGALENACKDESI